MLLNINTGSSGGSNRYGLCCVMKSRALVLL